MTNLPCKIAELLCYSDQGPMTGLCGNSGEPFGSMTLEIILSRCITIKRTWKTITRLVLLLRLHHIFKLFITAIVILQSWPRFQLWDIIPILTFFQTNVNYLLRIHQ
jgi:hypothetical protein